jgi:D-cysteine desulfhydrase family pyridoxal phosphate-dependent enzyme
MVIGTELSTVRIASQRGRIAVPYRHLPRFPLAHLPTPLEAAPRLSAALGGPRVLIKRDDLTGLALGGNKTRKLEYLIADALGQRATVVITAGGTVSNHCRQTAAAARIAGLRCVLVHNCHEADPEIQGNFLLSHLFGAEFRFVREESERPAMMEAVAAELRAAGERPYIIPGGGSNPLGATAYVQAMFELVEQLQAMGEAATHLYVTASTSGGTFAGLALGAKLARASFELVGIVIEDDAAATAAVVAPLANATAEFLGVAERVTAADLNLDDRFVGPGYATPTEGCLEAITLAARTEGLLLEPVYTGKTLAGLIAHARSGRLGKQDTVVFLHTGGAPALFSYAEVLAAYCMPG